MNEYTIILVCDLEGIKNDCCQENSGYVVQDLSFVLLYDEGLLCGANIHISEMGPQKKKGLRVG